MDAIYAYDVRIPEALARHGLMPMPGTAPERLRNAVSDLYRYEIRRLREKLLAGRIPKRDYAGHVVVLRQQYWILSVPIPLWTASRTGV